MKICASCGISFVPTGYNAKFCTKDCYYDSKRKSPPKPKACLFCGELFTVRGTWTSEFWKRKYCSRNCSAKSQKQSLANFPDKHCVSCGELITFPPNYKLHQAEGRKLCDKKCRTGERHPNWEGGRFLVSKGYIRVNTGIGTTDYEHIVVAKQVLGRELTKDELVHHIDLDKTNNAPENFLLLSNSKHRWLHEELGRRYMQEHNGILPPDLLALGIWLGDKSPVCKNSGDG